MNCQEIDSKLADFKLTLSLAPMILNVWMHFGQKGWVGVLHNLPLIPLKETLLSIEALVLFIHEKISALCQVKGAVTNSKKSKAMLFAQLPFCSRNIIFKNYLFVWREGERERK